MVGDTVTDGVRIAELLSSELHGRTDGVLANVAVANADRAVEPSVDGEHAYDVVYAESPLVGEPDRDVEVLEVDDGAAGESGERLAAVFVQPERIRVEFAVEADVAADAAAETRLRVRPKASRPPRTLVFVESGAAVKAAADVAIAVAAAALADDDA